MENTTKKALQKILNIAIVSQYPGIEKIVIDVDESDYLAKHEYKIFVGVSPDNLYALHPDVVDEIRNEIVQYTRYIIDPKKEKIVGISYFDSRA
jgi:hypothetical protein